MVNLNGFDANNVEPTSFAPIPSGDYNAVITSSEMKTTKNGKGEYLALTVAIIDGDHKGRKLWDNLNLRNANAQAVQIAQGTLSAICRAVNVMKPSDSAELHNKPLVITVGIEKQEDRDPQNRIKGYKPSGSATSVTSSSNSETPFG